MVNGSKTIILSHSMIAELISYARAAAPEECCGLIGSVDGMLASTVYAMQNVATDRRIAYEASAGDLFSAQREMRARGETIFAIYHSHPASSDPYPSETDVRLAYYPNAFYIIIGLKAAAKVRAFCVGQHRDGWTEFPITMIQM